MKITNNKENLKYYMSLTDKQRLFVDAYLANRFNATKAAIEAGYSDKTARVIGAENLTKPNIKAAIEERSAEISKKHELTIEFVINTSKKVLKKAFDIPVFDKNGNQIATRIDGATCVSVLNLFAKFLGMFDGNRADRIGKPDEQQNGPFGIVLNLDGNNMLKPDLSQLSSEDLETLQEICDRMKSAQKPKPIELVEGAYR